MEKFNFSLGTINSNIGIKDQSNYTFFFHFHNKIISYVPLILKKNLSF